MNFSSSLDMFAEKPWLTLLMYFVQYAHFMSCLNPQAQLNSRLQQPSSPTPCLRMRYESKPTATVKANWNKG
ncbi:hypothetical protein M514_10095 [Trichuris suis]|uniref:Uncharacterized protein n=1 Tax=Trichuris suis TaxID=68888 RepID=A0A085MU42_9BILA|nr:hypothetical protein M513_10095 [Trichuris suis]KFD60738.1 hypothetical protein M514_10095 [Trichuris suis]